MTNEEHTGEVWRRAGTVVFDPGGYADLLRHTTEHGCGTFDFPLSQCPEASAL